jgi:hypothetical protein
MNDANLSNAILALPMFADLSIETREHFAQVFLDISERVSFEDGDYLMREGDLGWITGYIIVAGEVVVERVGSKPIDVGAPAIVGEMQQFNPRSQRTATVRADGPVSALVFSWQNLYHLGASDLSGEEQRLLRNSIELLVLERFEQDTVMDVPLFRDLPGPLKVRACLLLMWLARDVAIRDGERLFDQGGMCGGIGYLLMKGTIRLKREHQPPKDISAPEILGIIPKPDLALKWSATAVATGEVEILKFDWATYSATLDNSLTPGERESVSKAFEAAAADHFAH